MITIRSWRITLLIREWIIEYDKIVINQRIACGWIAWPNCVKRYNKYFEKDFEPQVFVSYV